MWVPGRREVQEPAAAGDWVIAQVGCLRCSRSRRLGKCSGRLGKQCNLHRKYGSLQMAASATSWLPWLRLLPGWIVPYCACTMGWWQFVRFINCRHA